jgi:hypothetical protein
MQVTVWDPRAQAADFVRRYVADAWPAMARLGMTADASPDALRFCATAEEAVTDAEFVQENAPNGWQPSASYMRDWIPSCPRTQC